MNKKENTHTGIQTADSDSIFSGSSEYGMGEQTKYSGKVLSFWDNSSTKNASPDSPNFI